MLWGRIEFISQARQYARIEYLIRFDNQILLELHEKNQLAINSSFAQAIIKNDQRVNTILEYHGAEPTNSLKYILMVYVFILCGMMFYSSSFWSKFKKSSLLLVVRVDFIDSFLIPFLFTAAVTFVAGVFQTFFIEQFLLFFKNLNKLQKIKFLKNFYSLLVGLLIVSIFFSSDFRLSFFLH